MTVSSQSAQRNLSIRLSTDGFSFSVLDPSSDDGPTFTDLPVDETRSLAANLRGVLRQNEALGQPYRRVNVLIASRRWTVMPLELFEDEQAEAVLGYVHTVPEHEEVSYNVLTSSNAVVVFALDRAMRDLLLAQWPEAKFFAQSTPLIEHFARRSHLGNSRKLYAFIHHEHLGVYAFERGHLLLANSMECRETADRIYYLMYIWRQLGLEQKRDELHLSGLLPEKDELLAGLRRYVNCVCVAGRPEHLDLQVAWEVGLR